MIRIRTNTRTVFASSLQPSETVLSFFSDSDIYINYILSEGSPESGTSGDERQGIIHKSMVHTSFRDIRYLESFIVMYLRIRDTGAAISFWQRSLELKMLGFVREAGSTSAYLYDQWAFFRRLQCCCGN